MKRLLILFIIIICAPSFGQDYTFDYNQYLKSKTSYELFGVKSEQLDFSVSKTFDLPTDNTLEPNQNEFKINDCLTSSKFQFGLKPITMSLQKPKPQPLYSSIFANTNGSSSIFGPQIECPVFSVPFKNREFAKAEVYDKGMKVTDNGSSSRVGLCCSKGVCRAREINDSPQCNLMDSTFIEDNENVDLYKLLSRVTLEGSTMATNHLYNGYEDYDARSKAQKELEQYNKKLAGTKEFCSNCYSQIFQQSEYTSHPKDKSAANEEFQQIQDSIKEEIARDAANKVYIKMFQQYFEQKLFYEKHKELIDKELKGVFDGDKAKQDAYLNKLLCKSENYLQDDPAELEREYSFKDSIVNDCPNAKEHLQNFFTNIGAKEYGDKIENAYSSNTSKHLLSAFEVMADTYHAKAAEIKLKNESNVDSIYELYENLFLNDNNLEELFDICFPVGGLESKGNLGDNILKVVFKGKDESDLPEGILKHRIQVFNQMTSVVNILDPNLVSLTRDPSELCSLISKKMLGEKVSIKSVSENLQDVVERRKKDEVPPPFLLNKLSAMAKTGCLEWSTQHQNTRVLCGDISDTSLPIKLDTSKLDERQKLALGKIQCEESIGIIDSTPKEKGGFYDESFSIKSTFMSLAHDPDFITKTIKNMNTTNNNVSKNPEGAGTALDVLPSSSDIPTSTNNSGVPTPPNLVSSANLLEKQSGGDSFEDRMREAMDGILVGGIPSVAPKASKTSLGGPGEVLGEVENSTVHKETPVTSSASTDDVYSSFKKEVQAVNSAPYTEPYQRPEVTQFIDKNDTYSEVLDAIEGADQASKEQNLTDYLNNPVGEVPLDKKVVASKGDGVLEKQLESLRSDLAAEKQKTRQTELNSQLTEANERINKLEKYIFDTKTTQRGAPQGTSQNTSRKPASNNTSVANQITSALPKQALGEVRNGNFLPLQTASSLTSTNLGNIPNISGKKLQNIISNRGGEFQFKNNQLTLIATKGDRTEYTVNLEDIVIEAGEVKSIKYNGAVYPVEKLGLGEESLAALNEFAKSGQTKLIVKDLENLIKDDIQKNPNQRTPSSEAVRYIQMLCTMDPEHKNCQASK